MGTSKTPPAQPEPSSENTIALDGSRLEACLSDEIGREGGPLYGMSRERIEDYSREAFPPGVSKGTIRNAIRGNRILRNNALILARLVGQSVAYLSGETDDKLITAVPAHQMSQAIASLSDAALTDLASRLLDHLIDYGAPEDEAGDADEDVARQRRVERLTEDLRHGRISSDPSKPDKLYRGIPKFFWKEETRTRKIVMDAFFFVSPEEHLETPTEEWRDAFRMYSSKASDPRLQSLWSRILGYEMRAPGSISMMTLALLPALTPQIAQDFVRFCGGLFDIEGSLAYIRPRDDKGPNHYLEMFGLDFARVVVLEEFGLIRLHNRDLDIKKGCLFHYANRHFHARADFRVSINTLTLPGRDLHPIVSPEPSLAYLKGVHKSLGKRVSRYKEPSA